MVHIGPTLPVTPTKTVTEKSPTGTADIAVSKQAGQPQKPPAGDRRRHRDRRRRRQRPLLELRSGRDRRRNARGHPSIDVNA